MHFLDVIFSLVWDISDWCYNAYLTTKDWVWPFNYLADVFAALDYAFFHMLTPIAHAHDWVVDVTSLVKGIISFDTIKALLRYWLDRAEWAWEWVQDAWYYVTNRIDDWWRVAQGDVRNWITIATQGFSDLVAAWDDFWTITWPELLSVVNRLSTKWDDFWVNIFPTLVSFTWLTTWWNERVRDIDRFIRDAFTDRESWWAGWQEIREQVFDFFSDPEDWLYKAVDRIIERFW